MLWSILIAGIPQRFHTTLPPLLYSILEKQKAAYMADVELLYLLDNRRRPVGGKRNVLLDAARGAYVSFVDDDDEVSETYVRSIYRVLSEAQKRGDPPDVVCFPQRAALAEHGIVHECTYSLDHWRDRNPEERRQLHPALDDKGKVRPDALLWTGPPAHTMVWRREIIGDLRFPEKTFGEDVDWVDAVCAKAQTEIQIPGEPLYIYRFSEQGSATR